MRKFLFLLMCCCSFCLFGQHQNSDNYLIIDNDTLFTSFIKGEVFTRVESMPSWIGCAEIIRAYHWQGDSIPVSAIGDNLTNNTPQVGGNIYFVIDNDTLKFNEDERRYKERLLREHKALLSLKKYLKIVDKISNQKKLNKKQKTWYNTYSSLVADIKPLEEWKYSEECTYTKLMKFISKNTVYLAICKENNIEGIVYVEMTINKKGAVSKVRLVPGSEGRTDENLEKAAIAVIRMLPDFKPGRQQGRLATCKFNIPITFSIN